jgi:hypothetical protein
LHLVYESKGYNEGMHQTTGWAAGQRLERFPSDLPLLRLDGPQVMPKALERDHALS